MARNKGLLTRGSAASRDEQGFTLVEIVMALALFMIIFVGIMTFMQTNMISSALASSRAKAVNVASSYIEQVRALPYDSIGVQGGDPVGVLAEQTFTSGSLTFHVVPTVEWHNDTTINGAGGTETLHDMKRVTVTVTASSSTSSGLTPATYTLSSMISRAGGTATATALPTVEFDTYSPAKNAYVSGIEHVGAVVAAVQPGSEITNLNMYATDSQKGLLFDASLRVAQWPPLSWSNLTFQWDTQSVDASGVPLYPDGPHNLSLQVFDNLGKSAYVVRPVIVVNNPPSVPIVVLTAPTSTTEVGTWNVCKSATGNVEAGSYEWELYDQYLYDTNASDYSGWNIDASGSTTGTTVSIPNTSHPFDRLLLKVRSVRTTLNNPSGFKSAWGSAIVVSRPELTSLNYANAFSGSGSNKKWTTTISNPSMPNPLFPVSSKTVEYFRNSTMTTATATPITLPYAFDTA